MHRVLVVFVNGRHITLNICIASPVINIIFYKFKGGNVTSKIDIKKVFDTLNHDFLLHILSKFDFHKKFWNWNYTIIHSFSFLSILRVNGGLVGFLLKWKRSLSKRFFFFSLLYIAKETLRRGILHSFSNSKSTLPITSPKKVSFFLLIFFKQMIFFFFAFYRANKKSLRSLMLVFQDY